MTHAVVVLAIALIACFLVKSKTTPPITQNPPIAHPDITVSNLSPNQTIDTPFVVTGMVKGAWFFEASFPVFMKDNVGNQLGFGLAGSPQDWMTVNQIPFSVTLPATNYQGPGTVVFTKDNPSGEPQFDDSYTVPVVFQ